MVSIQMVQRQVFMFIFVLCIWVSLQCRVCGLMLRCLVVFLWWLCLVCRVLMIIWNLWWCRLLFSVLLVFWFVVGDGILMFGGVVGGIVGMGIGIGVVSGMLIGVVRYRLVGWIRLFCCRINVCWMVLLSFCMLFGQVCWIRYWVVLGLSVIVLRFILWLCLCSRCLVSGRMFVGCLCSGCQVSGKIDR